MTEMVALILWEADVAKLVAFVLEHAEDTAAEQAAARVSGALQMALGRRDRFGEVER